MYNELTNLNRRPRRNRRNQQQHQRCSPCSPYPGLVRPDYPAQGRSVCGECSRGEYGSEGGEDAGAWVGEVFCFDVNAERTQKVLTVDKMTCNDYLCSCFHLY